MLTPDSAKAKRANGAGFISYAGQRLTLAMILIVGVVGGAAYLLNHFDLSPAIQTVAETHQQPESIIEQSAPVEVDTTAEERPSESYPSGEITQSPQAPGLLSGGDTTTPHAEENPDRIPSIAGPTPAHPPSAVVPPSTGAQTPAQGPTPKAHLSDPAVPTETTVHPPKTIAPVPGNDNHLQAVRPESHPRPAPHAQQSSSQVSKSEHSSRPIGVTFMKAVIQPMDNELNQRILGWRPNDMIQLGDNTKNHQLGVLEVTRRTTVHLAERLSRTGSTDAFNPHLQNAMNWFMVKADRYWFPAPESKYKESLKELEAYQQELLEGAATLYTRTDNLIPLLRAYENLLGSCDENLVKHTEADGSKVSMFQTDNYFYYAKGIASALAVILEAIHHDFAQILENRNGSELLHHAVVYCNTAAGLNPWFITDSDLDGLFANHRANMAAPISHARFYLSQLIETLST